MRFVIAALIGLLFSLTSRADCFGEHLREAMALNKERLGAYAKASGGASREVSKKLIRMERQMLVLSELFTPFDRWARPYEAQGIGVTCDSYVPMSGTPSFVARDPRGAIAPGARMRVEEGVDRDALKSAYRTGFAALAEEGERQLARLKRQPRMNCLTAHFLESIVRIARLAPRHEREAKARGLESPAWIHRKMIWGHLFFLKNSMDIDTLAAPLNAQGLPILCRDVPPIPLDV